MPTLTVSDRPAHDVSADVLVLFARPSGQASGPGSVQLVTSAALPGPAGAHLADTLPALRATGGADEVLLLPGVPGVKAALVAVTGLGHADPVRAVSAESVRRAAGAATRALSGRPVVAVLPPAGDLDTVAAVAEGCALGAYQFTAHRGVAARSAAAVEAVSAMAPATARPARPARAGWRRRGGAADEPGRPLSAPVAEVLLLLPKRGNQTAPLGAARETVARAQTVTDWQGWARDLVNTAPNVQSPQAFAEVVAGRAPAGVSVSVSDEQELQRLRCAGLLGVGLGSSRPPRLVRLDYRPRRARGHLAYVGKGITFDSGGLCLKPSASMVTMKCDMAGAAAVAAAVFAIADLGLPVRLTGYLCLAENLPGGTAQRPGDVLTMRDGQTVEVINTDAEGRLVLADGLCLASETNPDAIVDVATLTGAAITALGRRTTAVLANDEALQAEVTSAATRAGETVWPLPIAEEIRADLSSLVADLKHTGDSVGGCMVGAAFLREFVGTGPDQDPIPWAHLDIAGPAYNEQKPYGYSPKGGTGVAVRTLVSLAAGRVEEDG